MKRPALSSSKGLLILLVKGLWLLFVAAIALAYELPQRFSVYYHPTPPELAAYYEEKRKRRRASLLRRAFEIWQRKEHGKRSARIWKNHSNFYSTNNQPRTKN